MSSENALSTLGDVFLFRLCDGPMSTTSLGNTGGFREEITNEALEHLANGGLIDGDANMWTITDQGIAHVEAVATKIATAVMETPSPD